VVRCRKIRLLSLLLSNIRLGSSLKKWIEKTRRHSRLSSCFHRLGLSKRFHAWAGHTSRRSSSRRSLVAIRRQIQLAVYWKRWRFGRNLKAVLHEAENRVLTRSRLHVLSIFLRIWTDQISKHRGERGMIFARNRLRLIRGYSALFRHYQRGCQYRQFRQRSEIRRDAMTIRVAFEAFSLAFACRWKFRELTRIAEKTRQYFLYRRFIYAAGKCRTIVRIRQQSEREFMNRAFLFWKRRSERSQRILRLSISLCINRQRSRFQQWKRYLTESKCGTRFRRQLPISCPWFHSQFLVPLPAVFQAWKAQIEFEREQRQSLDLLANQRFHKRYPFSAISLLIDRNPFQARISTPSCIARLEKCFPFAITGRILPSLSL
jgi:hypothetical protein